MNAERIKAWYDVEKHYPKLKATWTVEPHESVFADLDMDRLAHEILNELAQSLGVTLDRELIRKVSQEIEGGMAVPGRFIVSDRFVGMPEMHGITFTSS